RHLAKAEGPALVHCSAGKDRTGMIVALTHIVLGVCEDDVLADYLLTNDPARIEPRMKAVGDFMEEATGRRPSEAAVRVAMGVEAEYLASAFAAMRERHGSVEAYMERVLGVDAALREALEARLLA
ncbi:MAG: tyrosine-protein phosphatase, partial [Caulobacteraceae bacterium]